MTYLENKDLEVQTQMSDTIFLDPIPLEKRVVWIDLKNTSDQDLNLSSLIARIQASGYKITPDPDKAYVRFQSNTLFVGKCDEPALKRWVGAGWGGPLTGAIAGGVIGGSVSDRPLAGLAGAGIGGIIGGAVEMFAGVLVKKVVYTAITDIQISVRSDKKVKQKQKTNVKQGSGTRLEQEIEEQSDWKIYRARVASTASKVNLTFEEAKSPLTERLIRSLAGVL